MTLPTADANKQKNPIAMLDGAMIRLDIFSDPVCPWCMIGKANLDRALAAHPDHPFAIEWHPFKLNPELPPQGASLAQYLERKFGSREKVVQMFVVLENAAQKAGVVMDFAKVTRLPRTVPWGS